MENILNQIDKVRQRLKKSAADILLQQKPFTQGMYQFSLFVISYYSRVRSKLKMDYDSFMIIQSVVSSSLSQLYRKKKKSRSYEALEEELDYEINKFDNVKNSNNLETLKYYNKLTIADICRLTGLPKETVRRKTNQLVNKSILRNSKKDGFSLGPAYKKIFQGFVPETTLEVSKLLKEWNKSGVIKSLINFKI